ncbi:ABC transporter permease [Oceanispirochaeta sp. M1]|uniref:ABC transporter permease n=2 Tax=Oceanispirochaeta TaxID=2035349 RepID=UPI000E09A188|nr:ABC transporter permease [Oceanispirochaeta sp. M1]RDG32376.1 ABC transporter permease [Oceanispirochaeta sp. M1]
MRMTKILHKHETYIFIFLFVMCFVIGIINPVFYSNGNIFSILKSSIVIGILSLGVLLVLVSGGIDVSFPVVAAFSLYCSSLIYMGNSDVSILQIYLTGMIIGALCGLLNGVLISLFNFPAMVVTLGTSSLLSGFMYTYIGTRINHQIPGSLVEWGKNMILQQTVDGKLIGLSSAYFLYFSLCILIFLFLKYTMLGRSVYMIGGSEESAQRLGLNTRWIKIFIYVAVGSLAGIAGITQSGFLRIANPFELYGSELSVIAAAILGGANIGGGKGSVLGTFLGVLVITIINTSLIIMGVSSYWQQVVVGLVVIIAVAAPILVNKIVKA